MINKKNNKEKQREKQKSALHIITKVYFIFITACYPLFVGTRGYDDIIHQKAQLFWTGTILFLVIFGIFYTIYRFDLDEKNKPEKLWKTFSISDYAVLAFILFLTISFVLSKYKYIAFAGNLNRNDGFLTYLLLTLSYFPMSRWYKSNKTDFNIFAISSIVVCFIGFLQFYGFDFLNLFPYTRKFYLDNNGNPLFSGFSIVFRTTLSNIDFVSTYVCMTCIFFGILFIKTKSKWKFLYLSAAITNYLLMIIGNADAGKVGLLGTCILLIPYWISERKTAGKTILLFSIWGFSYATHHAVMLYKIMPSWGDNVPYNDIVLKNNYSIVPLKLILAISILALSVSILLLFPKFTAWPKKSITKAIGIGMICVSIISGLIGVEVMGRKLPNSNIIYEAREIMHGRMHDDFGSYRGFVWRKSIEYFPEHPLFGTGPDTFEMALSEDDHNESFSKYNMHFDKAHNDFLQILTCNGIFALIAYFVLFIGLIISSINKAFKDEVALMALGAVLAYLIQSFFGIDSIVVTPVYWLMLSVLRSRQNTVID